MADFPYLYRGSHAGAVRYGEEDQYDARFRENVVCARAIEQAIRDHWDEASGELAEGCAQSVLERYGFKRVNFVLANSLQELKKSGCGHLVSEETYQWGQDTFVPQDGEYNRYYRVDTAVQLLEGFIRQAQEAYQALGLFGLEHCAGNQHELDYTGKVLVLSPDTLKESCWTPRDQLWVAEGGFGCSPAARGQAVYATCLGDGEKTRWNRADFIGVLKDEFLPDWAAQKLEELQSQKQSGPTMGGMG